jgi:asparagine synthase (glutamine-hydrolysing)
VPDTPLERLWGALTSQAGSHIPGALGAGRTEGDVKAGAALGVADARGHWLARSGSLIVALAGHPITEAADPAQKVLEDFRTRGRLALDGLKGSFAVAVVDVTARHALIAVDRMGIEPMCYGEAGGTFVFGTRADSVAARLGHSSAIDPQAVFDYLFFHMVPAPQTIFTGVRKLLPGQFAEYENGRVRVDFYWRMHYVDRPGAPEHELAARFRDLLPRTVSRVVDDRPVGTFLSGGTDSSTVTGILAGLQEAPVDAYSIGFDAPGFDEMEYARIAAQRYKARHHAYYITPDDVVAAIPRVAAAYDEPFGNASAVPVYYCAERARREGTRVMLAGDGGDELFGGNARYAKQKLFETYGFIPTALSRSLIEPLILRTPGLQQLWPLGKVRSYIEQARIPLPDRLESYNFVLRSDLEAMLEPDFLGAIAREHPLAVLREVYERTPSSSAINRMLHLDLKLTLADNDLRKVSTMCRLAGVDVRYPMLDDEMVALSGEVSPSGKVNRFRLRYFFKKALRDFLPPEILAKTKHGFGLPFGLWTLDHRPLYELAGDSLAAFRRRGFLRPGYIDQLLDQHRSGHASYYGVMVWVVMMLEQWLRSRVPLGATPNSFACSV